ncbi:MAG TPA: hypothetical protein VF937_06965, partial [Chloroflexota bacterium]
MPGPFGPGSFQATLSMPDILGGHDLVAYAHSSVTDQESVVSVPISLGEDPSKAFVDQPTASVTEMCTAAGRSIALAMSPPAATAVSTTATGGPRAGANPPSTSNVTFQVWNPSPGDTVHAGGYMIEGIALDRAAEFGSGINRIDIF